MTVEGKGLFTSFSFLMFYFSFFRTAWLSARAESQVDFRCKKLLELPIPFKEREERLGIGLVACLSS